MNTGISIWDYFALTAVCLGVAGLALWLVSLLDGRKQPAAHWTADSIDILFDGDDVIQATDAARRILCEAVGGRGHGWRHVYRVLHARFPTLPQTVEAAMAMAPADLPADQVQDRARLRLQMVRGQLRLSLMEDRHATAADRHLRIQYDLTLRKMTAAAHLYPYPMWLISDDGTLDWANKAYLKLRNADAASAGNEIVPDLDLQVPEGKVSRTDRMMITNPESGAPTWFNVTKSYLSDGGSLNYASNIDTVIEAEIAQRKFVQTLTKTFAQLSTGLAIFDRERRLALFNPALIDLLTLPADFLSARPTLVSFFDRLRESRMMPEPKDYANWRQQITDIVIASVDGRFQETWTLPSGLTYRVTGRPHPDGAIALLFEDISAEISLTRRFRAQLKLGQAVIDTLDEAIAVFTNTGILTSSNRTYRQLWKTDPDSSFAEVSVADALRHWQSLARPNPFWARLRDYLGDLNDRTEWFADVTMKDGTRLECRVAPLAGGATLVGFRLCPVLEPLPQAEDEDVNQG